MRQAFRRSKQRWKELRLAQIQNSLQWYMDVTCQRQKLQDAKFGGHVFHIHDMDMVGFGRVVGLGERLWAARCPESSVLWKPSRGPELSCFSTILEGGNTTKKCIQDNAQSSNEVLCGLTPGGDMQCIVCSTPP